MDLLETCSLQKQKDLSNVHSILVYEVSGG